MDDKELEKKLKLIERDLRQYADKLCFNNNVSKEDLFQDTYVKVWSNKHMYRYDDSFKAWCKRVMYHLFIDQVKVENRLRSLEPQDSDISTDWYQEQLLAKNYNDAPSSITMDDILGSFDLLSNRDRRILEMFLIEGYNQQEIGEIFQIKPNNVKQIVYNARRLVMEELKEKFDINETYFSKQGLMPVQKKYRKKSTQMDTNYRKKFRSKDGE